MVFKNFDDYFVVNILCEWYGWLYYINDELGFLNVMMLIYEDASSYFVVGKSNAGTYLSKGYFFC